MEFVFANERHPESVRTVPWLRPAGGDSVPRDPADPPSEFQIDSIPSAGTKKNSKKVDSKIVLTFGRNEKIWDEKFFRRMWGDFDSGPNERILIENEKILIENERNLIENKRNFIENERNLIKIERNFISKESMKSKEFNWNGKEFNWN